MQKNTNNSTMDFLGKVETQTGLSGYAISDMIGVKSSQYYNWKRVGKQAIKIEYLCKIAALPKMNWKLLGEWLSEEFLPPNGEK